MPDITPSDEAPTIARAMGDMARAEQPALLPEARAPFCTVVTTDRRIIELAPTERGGLLLTVEGRGIPLELDPFQAGAFKAAVSLVGAAA